MKLILHTDGLQMTAATKQEAEDKFMRLRRVFGRLDHSDLLFNVELSRTTTHHKKGKIFRAEAHMPIGKHAMFVAVEGEDLLEAIDHCIAACRKQLTRIKEKLEN